MMCDEVWEIYESAVNLFLIYKRGDPAYSIPSGAYKEKLYVVYDLPQRYIDILIDNRDASISAPSFLS